MMMSFTACSTTGGFSRERSCVPVPDYTKNEQRAVKSEMQDCDFCVVTREVLKDYNLMREQARTCNEG